MRILKIVFVVIAIYCWFDFISNLIKYVKRVESVSTIFDLVITCILALSWTTTIILCKRWL